MKQQPRQMSRRAMLAASGAACLTGAVGVAIIQYDQDHKFRSFINPGPIPKIKVDCSANPYDVRVYARAIMKAANWLLERIPEDKPLIIMMGEYHNIPSHIMSILAVLKELEHLNQPFEFGFEKSHITSEKYNMTSLSELMIDRKDNPLSRGLLFGHCARKGIKIHFNDVAIKWQEEDIIFDQSDAFTRDIIKKYAPKMLDKTIYRDSNFHNDSLGIELSNRAMFEKDKDVIENTDARIYLAQTGGAHVAGADYIIPPIRHEYNTSRHALFTAEGYTVLSCFAKQLHLPSEAETAMKWSITPEGMNQTLIDYDKKFARDKETQVLKKINWATDGMVFSHS